MRVSSRAAGLVANPGVDETWSGSATMLGQSAVYLITGMIGGVALLASAPAIVAGFALPTAWAGVVSLPFLDGVAPWTDTIRPIGPLSERVLSATEWAHAGTTLALWMIVPLLIGIYRVTLRGISA